MSDVLVENFVPGTVKRWNIDYATLSAINPRLIYVSVSGWGQTGPYSLRPGYDAALQAAQIGRPTTAALGALAGPSAGAGDAAH